MTLQSNKTRPRAKRSLFTRCCDGEASSEMLHDMYDREREITLRTFALHVNIVPFAQEMGYAHGRHAKGLRLAKDWAVRFYKSVYRGEPCYYMDHSAIDHIFLHHDQAARLRA